jgi:NAD-dependent dihydropyrimidine dehydrogenase PreA subunit
MQGIRRMIAMVDQEQCTGCGICIDACPEQAISVKQLAAVDSERCIGCGACIPECPNESLSLEQQIAAPARGAAG